MWSAHLFLVDYSWQVDEIVWNEIEKNAKKNFRVVQLRPLCVTFNIFLGEFDEM